MKRIRTHLSYANATATLALLFALSGGAIAATGGFSSGGKLQACVNDEGALKLLKSGKHCRRGLKTVAWNVAGPTGAKGATGAAGAEGAAGAKGASGAAGTPGKDGKDGKEGAKGADGTAIAYAHVSATGAADPERSKNVTTANIENFGTGAWCFHGLSFTPKNVVATLTNFTLGFITVGVAPDIGACPAGTQARVQTWNDAATPVITAEAFEVLFN